jgi:hypothetical protein
LGIRIYKSHTDGQTNLAEVMAPNEGVGGNSSFVLVSVVKLGKKNKPNVQLENKGNERPGAEAGIAVLVRAGK